MKNYKNKKNRIELLAPAGSIEKMKYAIEYGADAVFLGVPDFSLRVRINKFTENDIKKAAEYAHKLNKKIYVTLNIYAHNSHLPRIEKHLKFLRKLKVDGVIVSDPGIINLVKKHLPKTDTHLSTQANATNWQAVKFWKNIGVKRIILAREVTLEEIKEIRKMVPGVELEYFVHGAMCMSYSGRCILSKWMTDRSANLGDCSQPCRWQYKTMNNEQGTVNNKTIRIKDDKERYGMDVEEDRHGTYFFNSYDMNLIEHVDGLIKAGVTSLKIEGRAKSAYYLAVVTRGYRKVVDAIEHKLPEKEIKKIISEQKTEFDNLVHRGYSTGFLLGEEPQHNFKNAENKPPYKFVGEILGSKNGLNAVKIHNEIYLKDRLEAVGPQKNETVGVIKIYDYKKNEVLEAHGGSDRIYYMKFNKTLEEKDILRKIG
ncbi:MAG TPA: U32 family peptidase C-terminal domain-containing protein [Candidatus Moranbacteria bacterium]|nr:U32 family peptidase C-terminal domain-containing protein [Candidatus Moranbacteria bacterium]